VGTPAASDLTLAPGAGHGGEGDASFQGPAQEEALSAQPKPTNAKVPANAEAATDEAGSVITLAARTAKPEVVEMAARETGGLVMTRPKPEKRKNAKERLEKRKGKAETVEVAEVAAVVPVVSGLATAHPKPERRKNAKERAQEKFKAKPAEDGTTPDMTAKAKSKAALKKAELKAAKSKAKKDKKKRKSAAGKVG